jgi:hypothetical protein
MRMAADHLAHDRLNHVAELERPLLLRHPGMEHDLEQQVAEFVPQVRKAAALDRVGDLVGLLDRVRGDRSKGLALVPGTTSQRIAQRRHQLDQGADVAGRLHRSALHEPDRLRSQAVRS